MNFATVIVKEDLIARSQSRGSSHHQLTPLEEPTPEISDAEEDGEGSGGQFLYRFPNRLCTHPSNLIGVVSNDGDDYPSLRPFGHKDAKKMLVSVKIELSLHEARVREIVNNAVDTSQRAVLNDLEAKHNALMKENEKLRKLYLSEMTAHRTSLDNLARLLQLKDRLTDK